MNESNNSSNPLAPSPEQTQLAVPVSQPAQPASPASLPEAPKGLTLKLREDAAAGKPATGYQDRALAALERAGLPRTSSTVRMALEGDLSGLRALSSVTDSPEIEAAIAFLDLDYATRDVQAERQHAEVLSLAHETLGGKEQWEAAANWVRANADPAELEELAEALDNGGASAKMALRYIAGLYQRFGGEAPTEQSQPKPQSAVPFGKGQVAAKTEALSAVQYASEVNKFMQTNPNASDEHPVLKALQSRRIAGMRAGL